MIRMTTTRGNVYTLDDTGAVVARSNGPDGWNYSGKWIILGFTKRHHSRFVVSLTDALAGEDIGQGWIHDLDHGTRRRWGTERVRSIARVSS